jgi:autotransporter translocation and assembly factor TamB
MTALSITRRLVFALTGLLLVIGAAVILVIVVLNTPSGEATLRRRLEAILTDATGARVSIGHLGGSLVRGVSARDVSLVFPGGSRLAVAELAGSYTLPALVSGRFVIGSLHARGVRVRLVHTAAGWGFSAPGSPAEESPTSLPDLRILHVTVEDGRAALLLADANPPQRFALAGVSLDASFAMNARTIRIGVAALHGVPRGIDVSPLSTQGTLTVATSGEDVRVDGLVLSTQRSRIAGNAFLASGRRVDARLELSPLAARELRALVPAATLVSDVGGTVVARGPWRAIATRAALRTPGSGRARMFGVLDAGGSDVPYRAAASVGHLDLAAIDPTLPASDLTGHVNARGAVTSLETPLDVQLRLAPSSVAGIAVSDARLAGRITSVALDAHGVVGVAAGRADVDGHLSWAGEPTYQGRASVEVNDLAAIVSGLPGSVRLHATVEGRGFDAPGRVAAVGVRIDGGRVRGVPLDGGTVSLALRGDTLGVQNGTVLAAGLRVDATGGLDLRRQTLDATATVAGDVGRGARAMGADVGGTLSARLQAHGPLRQLALDVTTSGNGVRFGTTSLERVTGTASLAGVGGESATGRATVDLSALRTGRLSPWSGTARVDWQRVRGSDTASVNVTGHDEDRAQLATRATIHRTPAGDVDAQLADFTLETKQHGTWTLVRPATIALAAGTLSVDRLQLGSGSQRIAVAGRAGLTGPADASADWQDIDLAEICRLRNLTCTGVTDGSVRLTGTAASPVLSLTTHAGGVVVEQSPSTAFALTGSYADRSVSLRGTVTQEQTGQLDATGVVPVDLGWEGPRHELGAAPVDVTARTNGLDLSVARLFAPESIRQSAGRVVGDLRLHGPLDDLRAEGTFSLRDGKIALAATGVTYEDIEILASASGQKIELDRVHARAGHGTVDGSGNMALVVTRTTPFALRLTFHEFLAVSLPAYEAATDGSLTIEGAIAYPVVRGELTLSRFLLRPSVLTTTSGPSLEPDPTIEVVGLPETANATASQAQSPPLDLADALSLDVGIHITHDAWIRRDDADVELRGNLRLGKAAYHPLFINGDIRLVRGWYAFQGRRFDLDEGRIIFGGDVPPDPQLDIRARNRTGDYTVTIQIAGRATEPTLTLSSEPQLEQADILSLLVFGRPARDLGHEQSLDLQRKAISLASGYVMPELRQSMMNTLGLDTLEVGDEGVRAGRYVTRDIFITLAQDFTGRTGQVMGVEYSVTRRLSLKLSTSTRGDSAVDLFWHRRY